MKSVRQSAFVTWLVLFSIAISVCGSTVFAKSSPTKSLEKDLDFKQEKFPLLSRYAVNLTEMARRGLIDASDASAAEVTRAVQILSRDKQNNPVLTTESIVESNAVAEALAVRITKGDVPSSLAKKRLFRLNLQALFAGIKTSADFNSRLQSIFSEIAKSRSEIILFAPELQEFVGARTSRAASQEVINALLNGDVQIIGATSAAAYAEYIKSDLAVSELFLEIRTSQMESSASSRFEAGKNADDYVGDRVSPDLRDALNNSPSTNRVKVILQLADIRDAKSISVLERSGVQVNEQMMQLGVLAVDLPLNAVRELAAISNMRYISMDQEARTLGHIEDTTGAIGIRSLLGGGPSGTLDGNGIGIAIIDSGVWEKHHSIDKSISAKVDFTGENKPNEDPYGHGSHVASLAAGSLPVGQGAFNGIAPTS